MKSNLVFYLARKTSYCEKALKKTLSQINIELNNICASTTPIMLGEKLTDALSTCNLVFIIGGLGFSGENRLSDVLSRALATSKVQITDVKKLSNPVGKNCGYLIRSGRQLLVALPDNPEELKAMLSQELKAYIADLYGLN
ncbi:MAG: hypothetical protein IJZ54_06800 [Clostridia bacterium]|nr:hypothetical protein [Clostridia bacterium]